MYIYIFTITGTVGWLGAGTLQVGMWDDGQEGRGWYDHFWPPPPYPLPPLPWATLLLFYGHSLKSAENPPPYPPQLIIIPSRFPHPLPPTHYRLVGRWWGSGGRLENPRWQSCSEEAEWPTLWVSLWPKRAPRGPCRHCLFPAGSAGKALRRAVWTGR